MPRNNRFYSWIIRTRPLYRYTITTAGCLSIWCVWFFTCYGWVASKIDQCRQDVCRLHEQCMHGVTCRKSCIQLNERVAQLRDKLQLKTAYCKHAGTVQMQIEQVLGHAKQCKLTLNAYGADNQQSDNSVRTFNDAQFEFIGDIPNLVHFLHVMRQESRAVSCKRMDVSRRAQGDFNIRCHLRFAQNVQVPARLS